MPRPLPRVRRASISSQGLLTAGPGYECSFVEDLPKEVQTECSICLNVLREPYMVGCCGYRFCRNCIVPVQKSTGRCPLCNNSFHSLPDKHLERILLDRMVYCSHRDERSGCQWQGKLMDFDSHIRKCMWTKVPCPHCQMLFTQSCSYKITYQGLFGEKLV